jgi:hypothetical protein
MTSPAEFDCPAALLYGSTLRYVFIGFYKLGKSVISVFTSVLCLIHCIENVNVLCYILHCPIYFDLPSHRQRLITPNGN